MFSEYTPKCNLNSSIGRVRPFLFHFSGKSQMLDRIVCLPYTQNLTVGVERKNRISFTHLDEVWLPLFRILRNSSYLINYVETSCTKFDLIVQKFQKIRAKFYLRPYEKYGFPYTSCHKTVSHSMELHGDILHRVVLKSTKKYGQSVQKSLYALQ